MKFKIILLFFFIPVLSSANEIEIIFNCQNNSVNYDYYQTEDICHFIPLKDIPVIVLNEFTNTEINKEMLFALTSNHYIKKGFNTEALISDKFGYLKLNKKDVEVFTEVFGDEIVAKKFITYHELGHIYFNNASEYTLEREMFSDLFALRLLTSEGYVYNEVKNNLMEHRKSEAIEKDSLTHYTTFFIEKQKEKDLKCVSNELSCIISEIKKKIKETRKKDVFKKRLISNIKKSERKWFYGYKFITEDVYNKRFPYDISKEDLIKEIENFPEVNFISLLKNKKLKYSYLRMLNDEFEHSQHVSKEEIQ